MHRTVPVSRGVDRFFNNVLSSLASAALLLLLYLNYIMFETYIAEFLFAFIFSEALWNTKFTITKWLSTANSISLRADVGFSLRREVFSIASSWMSAFSFDNIFNINRDSSDVYLQAGLLVIAFVVKPEACFLMSVTLVAVLCLIGLFNNRLLFLFRIHHYLGVNDDTFVALLLIGGIVLLSIVGTGVFAIVILKDIKLLTSEVSFFVESQMSNGDSWANAQFREVISLIKPILGENLQYVEAAFDNSTQWGRLVSKSLAFVDSFGLESNVESSSSLVDNSGKICLDSFEVSFNGVSEFAACFKEDLLNMTSLTPLLEPLKSFALQSGSLLMMTTTLPLLLLDLGFRLLFFLTMLFLLLSSKETVLQSLINSVQHNDRSISADNNLLVLFETEVQTSMAAVLILPLKLSLLNALATLSVFWLFDIQVMYVCASLVFLFSMFPVITPFLIIIPWLAFYVAAYNHSYSWALVTLLVHYSFHYVVSTWALIGFGQRTNKKKRKLSRELDSDNSSDGGTTEGNHEANLTSGDEDDFPFGKREYVTSLSMFFGLVTFGLKGIVIGPFIFCLVTICHKIYVNYRRMLSETTDSSEDEELSLHENITTPKIRRIRTDSATDERHSSELKQAAGSLRKMKSQDEINKGLKGFDLDKAKQELLEEYNGNKRLPSTSVPDDVKLMHRSRSALNLDNLNRISKLSIGIADYFPPVPPGRSVEQRSNRSPLRSFLTAQTNSFSPPTERGMNKRHDQTPPSNRERKKGESRESLREILKEYNLMLQEELISEEEYEDLRKSALRKRID